MCMPKGVEILPPLHGVLIQGPGSTPGALRLTSPGKGHPCPQGRQPAPLSQLPWRGEGGWGWNSPRDQQGISKWSSPSDFSHPPWRRHILHGDFQGSTASRGLGVGTCRLQGMLSPPWGRSPVSFEPIRQPSIFRGELRQAGLGAGLPRTVPRPRQGLLLACMCTPTPENQIGGRDLPSSGGVALTTGKVPSEFRANPPTFIFQGVRLRKKLRQAGLGASSPGKGPRPRQGLLLASRCTP